MLRKKETTTKISFKNHLTKWLQVLTTGRLESSLFITGTYVTKLQKPPKLL
jgi:hypothetical protein